VKNSQQKNKTNARRMFSAQPTAEWEIASTQGASLGKAHGCCHHPRNEHSVYPDSAMVSAVRRRGESEPPGAIPSRSGCASAKTTDVCMVKVSKFTISELLISNKRNNTSRLNLNEQAPSRVVQDNEVQRNNTSRLNPNHRRWIQSEGLM
jgi:hypothetical protein